MQSAVNCASFATHEFKSALNSSDLLLDLGHQATKFLKFKLRRCEQFSNLATFFG